MAKMTNNPVRIQFVRHNFSEIPYKNLRFLITDRPTDATMEHYIAELIRYNCKVVVRVCEPTYNTDKLAENGITVMDWQFPDGHGPPAHIVENWFSLLVNTFYRKGGQSSASTHPNNSSPAAVTATAASTNAENNSNGGGGSHHTTDVNSSSGAALPSGDAPSAGAASSARPPSSPQSQTPCVAVHCVAGLGRAPVLVAIALMERGVKYEDTVDLIRQRRPGALNMKQLEYLRQYKRTKRFPRGPIGSGVSHSGSGLSGGSSNAAGTHSNGFNNSDGDKQCCIL